MKKYISLDNLQLYDQAVKRYVNKSFERYKTKYVNCPNCGAPINGTICEYCGTDFNRLIYG